MGALSLATDAAGRQIYRRVADGNRWRVSGRVASVTNGGTDTIKLPKLGSVESIVFTPITNNVDIVFLSVSGPTVTLQSSGSTSDAFFTAIGR